MRTVTHLSHRHRAAYLLKAFAFYLLGPMLFASFSQPLTDQSGQPRLFREIPPEHTVGVLFLARFCGRLCSKVLRCVFVCVAALNHAAADYQIPVPNTYYCVRVDGVLGSTGNWLSQQRSIGLPFSCSVHKLIDILDPADKDFAVGDSESDRAAGDRHLKLLRSKDYTP